MVEINFDVPVPDSALIEASFTANPGDGPANLVTWTGDRIFGLFIDQNNCWEDPLPIQAVPT